MKYIRPLFDMFVFFAIVHIAITIILALLQNDYSFINVFYIESASELFPGIEKGAVSFAVSALIIAVVYGYFYLKRRKK